MSISRYIVVAVVRCSCACSRLPVRRVQLAEAEVAVGDERAHAARLGEGQRLAVVGLAALGVEPVGMGRDVAEQVQRMGREPGVTRRGFDRAVAQAARVVEPAEQQTRRDPARDSSDPTDEGRRFPSRPDARGAARLPGAGSSASLASPSCARTQAEEATAGKPEDGVPRPSHRIPLLDQRARFRPVALEQVKRARGAVGQADGVRMTRRLGEPDRLGFVLGRLGESAELGEAQWPASDVRRPMPGGASEGLIDPVGGQRREIVGGQFDRPLVFAPEVVRLLEIAVLKMRSLKSPRRPAIASARVPDASASSSSPSMSGCPS